MSTPREGRRGRPLASPAPAGADGSSVVAPTLDHLPGAPPSLGPRSPPEVKTAAQLSLTVESSPETSLQAPVPRGGRASLRGFAGKGFPGRSGEPAWKALQCPGRPLCGVRILAVCCLASQGWGASSQGSLLRLSSLPEGELAGNIDFVQNGVWCADVCILGMRWYCIAGLPSQVTLTSDPVKDAGQVCFLLLSAAGVVTKRGEIISKNPAIGTQPPSWSGRGNSIFLEGLMGTLNEDTSLSSRPLSLGLSTLPVPWRHQGSLRGRENPHPDCQSAPWGGACWSVFAGASAERPGWQSHVWPPAHSASALLSDSDSAE